MRPPRKTTSPAAAAASQPEIGVEPTSTADQTLASDQAAIDQASPLQQNDRVTLGALIERLTPELCVIRLDSGHLIQVHPNALLFTDIYRRSD